MAILIVASVMLLCGGSQATAFGIANEAILQAQPRLGRADSLVLEVANSGVVRAE